MYVYIYIYMNLKAYSYIIDFKEKHHQQNPGDEFLFLGWLESPEIYQERGLPLLFQEPLISKRRAMAAKRPAKCVNHDDPAGAP